jgi:Domain of unknown function (DUF4267)
MMPGRRRMDPRSRDELLAVAAGRVAIGVGTLVATRKALRLLGFPEPTPAALALGKLAGGRDVALGTLALLARNDRDTLRTAALAGAGVDIADALALGAAGLRQPETGRAGVLGALSGSSAALAGLRAARRL